MNAASKKLAIFIPRKMIFPEFLQYNKWASDTKIMTQNSTFNDKRNVLCVTEMRNNRLFAIIQGTILGYSVISTHFCKMKMIKVPGFVLIISWQAIHLEKMYIFLLVKIELFLVYSKYHDLFYIFWGRAITLM